jgi:hypothetical protein
MAAPSVAGVVAVLRTGLCCELGDHLSSERADALPPQRGLTDVEFAQKIPWAEGALWGEFRVSWGGFHELSAQRPAVNLDHAGRRSRPARKS